jgi:hypothetical protein
MAGKPQWEPDAGYMWTQNADGTWSQTLAPKPVDPNPITAQTKYVNPAGVPYDIEVSQVNGSTKFRVKGTTAWNSDMQGFYNGLGATTSTPYTPAAPAPQRIGYTPSEPAGSTVQQQQKTVASETVNNTVRSLTDSILRPKTAQATPTPVSKYKMNKTKGRFTIGI